MRLLVLFLALLAFRGEAHAHQTSLSYVSVEDRDGALAASVKMSFLDLEVSAGIDQDFDGRITWGEAKAAVSRIAAYVQSHTVMSSGGPCVLRQTSAEPETLNGEGYLNLGFGVTCPDKAPVAVASTIFLEIDPTSRVLVSSRTGGEAQSYVLGIEQMRAVEAALGAQAASAPADATSTDRAPASLLSYFWEGVSHLFGGPDHMLFLLVLVIPAIYAGSGIRSVAIAVLLPVTGFTLGHALTLTSAASGLIRPPAQIVEVLIAVTILLTAIDNIRSFIPGPRSVVAFAFGLIHGFGFASSLGALEVSGWQMAVALLGFNLGIEAGQAMLALAVAPALFLVRKPARRLYVLPTGVSVLAGTMAVWWIVERTVLV